MKATFVPLVFAVAAFAQSFTINTPANVAQCQPLQLTWSGGSPPYFLPHSYSISSVTPGAQPNGAPLVNLGQVNGSSFSWSKVNIQANTGIGFSLRDSTGALAQTATVTVNDSGDSSCLGQAPSGSGGTAAPPPATGAPGGSTPGATTSAGSPPASSSPAGSPPAGSTPSKTATTAGSSASATKSGASSATSTNAASANMVQTGAAGIIGAALIALLA